MEVDDYYDKKLERAWRKFEKWYDARTKRLVAAVEIKQMQSMKSTDKTMTKKQEDKLLQTIEKKKQKLEQKKIKDKTKKKESINHKENAHSLVQLYARILRADNEWYVQLIDKNQRVYYKECDWWHLYPKKNYPQLAFYMANIRPQSKNSNKRQWDNYGKERESAVLDIIWTIAFGRMVALSIDKQEKSRIRDSKYYIDEIKHLLPLVRQEFKKRNIEPHTLLLKLEKIYKKGETIF